MYFELKRLAHKTNILHKLLKLPIRFRWKVNCITPVLVYTYIHTCCMYCTWCSIIFALLFNFNFCNLQVDLSKEGEEKIIDFCRRHEAQLSYKSVINHVKVWTVNVKVVSAIKRLVSYIPATNYVKVGSINDIIPVICFFYVWGFVKCENMPVFCKKVVMTYML